LQTEQESAFSSLEVLGFSIVYIWHFWQFSELRSERGGAGIYACGKEQ
jgi:hypothetical protein